jgi:hypothetical protein
VVSILFDGDVEVLEWSLQLDEVQEEDHLTRNFDFSASSQLLEMER